MCDRSEITAKIYSWLNKISPKVRGVTIEDFERGMRVWMGKLLELHMKAKLTATTKLVEEIKAPSRGFGPEDVEIDFMRQPEKELVKKLVKMINEAYSIGEQGIVAS